MKRFAVLAITMIFSTCVYAGITSIKGDAVNNGEIKEVGIYFTGVVNNQTVTWLMSGLADIKANYRNVNNIDIYINSDGGDMDASYVAYESLRKSSVKLNMINASMTGSAATIIYCASPERYAMPMSRFLLHPAAAGYEKADYIKPDQARRIVEEDEAYNGLFRKVYSSCTSLTAQELNDITASEAGRKIYNVDDAIKHGLVTHGLKESRDYLLTYFITD